MLINARHCVHHSLHWKSGNDKTHRSGSNDADPESVGFLDEFLCLVLWYTLGYDGYNTELREREAVRGIGMYAEAVCTQTLVHWYTVHYRQWQSIKLDTHTEQVLLVREGPARSTTNVSKAMAMKWVISIKRIGKQIY